MITKQINNRFGIADYKGLSTDTKPTETVGLNALFLELDTGDFYYFNGAQWVLFGTSGNNISPILPPLGGDEEDPNN